jgi:hypothetical protein
MIDPECYVCHRKNIILVSVYAPGFWWICGECTAKYEQETGLVGIFFYSAGLKFVTKEEAQRLNEERNSEAKTYD